VFEEIARGLRRVPLERGSSHRNDGTAARRLSGTVR
jgi:hypothetical protein